MKTIQSIVFSLFLLGGLGFTTCSTARASEVPATAKVKAMSSEIKEKIVFPAELSEQQLNERVIVEFRMVGTNKIEVLAIDAKNEFLKTFVKEQLESMELESYEGFEGKTLQISLFFAN